MAVYMSNCLYLIHTTLSLYEFTEPALEKLDAQMQAHMDTLVDQQAGQFLLKVGLMNCYTASQAGTKLTEEELSALQNTTSRLTQFLSTPDTALLEQLTLLSSNRVRDSVRHRAMELFLAAYEQIYSSVAVAVGAEKCSELLMHSPQQARSLIE